MSTRKELSVELPASLEAIDVFCDEFREWRADACAGLEAFPAELLLREVLTNSVVHGSERICCLLRAKPGRLLIVVRDEGEGFDWRAAWDRQAGAEDTHGRGIDILRRYASAVRFNPKGNAVTLIKRFKEQQP
jgi:anti-sigma regulatory factor (Ser/Thr protein kinase)